MVFFSTCQKKLFLNVNIKTKYEMLKQGVGLYSSIKYQQEVDVGVGNWDEPQCDKQEILLGRQHDISCVGGSEANESDMPV